MECTSASVTRSAWQKPLRPRRRARSCGARCAAGSASPTRWTLTSRGCEGCMASCSTSGGGGGSGAEAEKGRKATSRSPARSLAVRRAAELAPEVVIVVRGSTGSSSAQPAIEVARLNGGASPGEAVELLLGAGERIELAGEQWEEVRGELKALVRDELAPLGADDRAAILATLAAEAALDGHWSFELSRSLHAIREVLRERLPRCAVNEEQPLGLAVEEILSIDDSSFWINGWMHDEDGGGEVTIVSPEGARATVTGHAFRYERPDVVQFYSGLRGDSSREHGFTAYVSLPGASRLADGWIAELRTSDGIELEIQCPSVVGDRQGVRSRRP